MNPDLSAEEFDVGNVVMALQDAAVADGRWEPCGYASGSVLLEQGETTNELLVLRRGLVKLAYATPDGTEWIKSFIVDLGLFSAVDIPGPAAESRFSAICLEDCEIVRLPLAWVARLIGEGRQLGSAYLGFSGWVRRRKEAREEALLCLSAEQRYRAFLASEPALAARLKLGDVARYLRVTPIALSRIRRRMGLSASAR